MPEALSSCQGPTDVTPKRASVFRSSCSLLARLCIPLPFPPGWEKQPFKIQCCAKGKKRGEMIYAEAPNEKGGMDSPCLRMSLMEELGKAWFTSSADLQNHMHALIKAMGRRRRGAQKITKLQCMRAMIFHSVSLQLCPCNRGSNQSAGY